MQHRYSKHIYITTHSIVSVQELKSITGCTKAVFKFTNYFNATIYWFEFLYQDKRGNSHVCVLGISVLPLFLKFSDWILEMI